jgi:hypothetical protein
MTPGAVARPDTFWDQLFAGTVRVSKPQLSREEHEYPVSKATKGREKKEEFADRARVGQVLSEVLTLYTLKIGYFRGMLWMRTRIV